MGERGGWARTLVAGAVCGAIVLALAAAAGARAGDAASPVAASVAAPDFELPGPDGAPVRLADFRGKVVFVNFFASWCGPCRQEMPILDRIHARYAPLGFSVLGVNVDKDAAAARRMLDEVKVAFPVALDTESATSATYGVDAMPSSVLVDRSGNIRHVHRGYQPGFEDAYVAQVKALVREPGN
jgi:peroxiredoxin